MPESIYSSQNFQRYQFQMLIAKIEGFTSQLTKIVESRKYFEKTEKKTYKISFSHLKIIFIYKKLFGELEIGPTLIDVYDESIRI